MSEVRCIKLPGSIALPEHEIKERHKMDEGWKKEWNRKQETNMGSIVHVLSSE